MDHFLDLRVRPDLELAQAHVMNTLFAKLHLALAVGHESGVGVSFPQVKPAVPSLGDTLRLHGGAAALDSLMATPWLRGLHDHLHIGLLAAAPAGAAHCRVLRVQARSSADRIRRRQMRRHGYTEVEARQRIGPGVERRLALPYVELRSNSTGQAFRLFIAHEPATPRPTTGTFNAYGLSHAGATVPWF